MKRLVCLLACVCIALPSVAPAQIKGSVYLGADAALSELRDTTVHGTTLFLPAVPKAQFDPGYSLSLRAGYQVPNGGAIRFSRGEALCDLALELETGFIHNNLNSLGYRLSDTGASIDFDQVPILANIILVFPFSERFRASIGAGAGAAFTAIGVSERLGQDTTSTDVGFAFQGFVRASYHLTQHLSVNGSLKSMVSPDASFPRNTVINGGLISLSALKMDGPVGLYFGFGLTYLF